MKRSPLPLLGALARGRTRRRPKKEKRKSVKTKNVRMEKIVLLAKSQLLGFYIANGYKAMRVSPIVHGKDPWFELERDDIGGSGQLPPPKEEPTPKGTECHVVDAFADPTRAGSGNPAAVVVLSAPPTDSWLESGKFIGSVEWMKVVAKEFNLAETAFVWQTPAPKPKDGGTLFKNSSNYGIRYYSRTGVEVDLCGHATLASASVLLRKGSKSSDKDEEAVGKKKITFHAKYDVLRAELVSDPDDSLEVQIAMDFPWKDVTDVPSGEEDAVLEMFYRAFLNPPSSSRLSSPTENGEDKKGLFDELLLAGSCERGDALASQSPEELTGAAWQRQHRIFSRHILKMGTTDVKEDLFIELTKEGFDTLEKFERVEYGPLRTGWDGYSRGVIVCCSCQSEGDHDLNASDDESDDEYETERPKIDFRSRFFGPKVGIDEDPVTGSAHCSLGPYFGAKLNKTVVMGRQESPGRGGVVECVLKGDEPRRVGIGGTAVATVSGNLLIGT